MSDLTIVASAAGLAGSVLGGGVTVLAYAIKVRNSVVMRDDCDDTQARRDKTCAECRATIVPLATIKEMLVLTAEKTRHDAREAMAGALLKHETLEGHGGTLKRLASVEQTVAVFTERFDVERREFSAINAKLDRILDAIPALTARVDALEEA